MGALRASPNNARDSADGGDEAFNNTGCDRAREAVDDAVVACDTVPVLDRVVDPVLEPVDDTVELTVVDLEEDTVLDADELAVDELVLVALEVTDDDTVLVAVEV